MCNWLHICLVQEADGSSRDVVERDERRLADLGRRCVEMFAAVHIASQHMEVLRFFCFCFPIVMSGCLVRGAAARQARTCHAGMRHRLSA